MPAVLGKWKYEFETLYRINAEVPVNDFVQNIILQNYLSEMHMHDPLYCSNYD